MSFVAKWKSANASFNYRVAGACIRDEYVLLHCWEACDFWALPGGRPEPLESAPDALVREMREETGLEAAVGRLLWVVENFYAQNGKRIHEVGLYFEMTLPEGSDWGDMHAEHVGHEGEMPIIFRWFPIDQLPHVRLLPAVLRTALANLPACPEHIVHIDPGEKPAS